jgi:hypothetical protein
MITGLTASSGTLGANELEHDPASGVEQDVLIAATNERGGGVASGIWPGAAGSEENDLHSASGPQAIR